MAKSEKSKKTSEKESRTSVVDAFRKTREAVSEKITGYNDKYVVKTIEKGREKAKQYNETYVAANIEKGREKAKYYNEKYMAKPIEKGIANGKRMIRKMPVVNTIEQKVTDRLNGLPSMVNMPSKDEIEKLTIAMENLNTKIENLNKQSNA